VKTGTTPRDIASVRPYFEAVDTSDMLGVSPDNWFVVEKRSHSDNAVFSLNPVADTEWLPGEFSGFSHHGVVGTHDVLRFQYFENSLPLRFRRS